MTKAFMTAQEVADTLGISLGKAYEIIRELNTQLEERGYITVRGKCSRKYFQEKYYGLDYEEAGA